MGYQGQRLSQTLTTFGTTTFTPAELAGDFSQAIPNGTEVTQNDGSQILVTCANPNCPDPGVAAFLQQNPSFATPGGNASQAIIAPTKINAIAAEYIALGLIPTSPSGSVTTTGPHQDNDNELTGKLDLIVTEKDRISVTLEDSGKA